VVRQGLRESFVERVVWWLLVFLEGLLALRLALLVVFANPRSRLVRLIYLVTEPLVAPFRALITHPLHHVGSEIGTVIAMVALVIIALMVVRFVRGLHPPMSI